MNKKNVWEEIQKQWQVIVDIYAKNYDLDVFRLRTRQMRNKLPQLEIIETLRRHKNTSLKVEFGKGDTIPSKNRVLSDVEVFLDVIQRVGIDNVEKLNLETQGGTPIIIDKIGGTVKKGYSLVRNKLVFTKLGIDEKKNLIEKMLDKLQINAKVTIV